ncbi:hypothetical protein GGX14DRAFT_392531 [Mycena pura]|uniref:Uncharacterized protein n=1 Tax=Mycena pura TaxID=153505 RepID=A0AAD6VJ37_9AGAR|nr:hypothetical protein GGX14DRAFT_392531 [Mycena pura]
MESYERALFSPVLYSRGRVAGIKVCAIVSRSSDYRGLFPTRCSSVKCQVSLAISLAVSLQCAIVSEYGVPYRILRISSVTLQGFWSHLRSLIHFWDIHPSTTYSGSVERLNSLLKVFVLVTGVSTPVSVASASADDLQWLVGAGRDGFHEISTRFSAIVDPHWTGEVTEEIAEKTYALSREVMAKRCAMYPRNAWGRYLRHHNDTVCAVKGKMERDDGATSSVSAAKGARRGFLICWRLVPSVERTSMGGSSGGCGKTQSLLGVDVTGAMIYPMSKLLE